jgi:methionyl-tRNA formyltransferase
VQVRGFAGWPGTRAKIRVCSPGKSENIQDLKILRSRVLDSGSCGPLEGVIDGEVRFSREGLFFPCGHGTVLVATEVQAAGRQACSGSAFANGLSGKRVFLEASLVMAKL